MVYFPMRRLAWRMNLQIDDVDRKILACLQRDASITIAELAEQVCLSSTPCWRRVQRLEKEGVIKARVALLDPVKLDLGISVFVQVKTNYHSKEWLDRFSKVVSRFPEVVEFYRVTGEFDYLLRVIVADIGSYDRFYKQLIEQTDLNDVRSSFAMEQIKYTTALPLEE
jgi:Lrp/AsnC family transcriptional regulator